MSLEDYGISIWTVVGLHAMGCLMPGASIFYASSIIKDSSFRNSLTCLLGVSIVNWFYILVSVIFTQFAFLSNYVTIPRFCIFGGLILFLIGIKQIFDFRMFNIDQINNKSRFGHCLTGAIIAACNPKPALVYLLLLSKAVSEYSFKLRVLVTAYFMISTFVLLSIGTYVLYVFGRKIEIYTKYIRIISGFAIILFGFAIFLMAWKMQCIT